MRYRIITFFVLLLGVAAIYGDYQPTDNQSPSQMHAFTHPVIANDQHRLKLISDIWDAIDKTLKNPSNGYLSNSRLTDAGRTFIKQNVPALMAKKVGKQSLAMDQDLQLLKNLLVQSIIASYSFLEWCPCIFPASRIDLAFSIVRDVRKSFPNRTTTLNYVSLGSGDLLQDFVTIAALIKQGYCDIDMVGIDFKYRLVRHTRIVDSKKRSVSGSDSSEKVKKVDQMIDAFRTSIADLIKDRPDIDCEVAIEPFIDAYAYIDAVKVGLEDSANILVMADPTRVLGYLEVATIGEANCVEFSENGLLLCMPELQKPMAYLPVDSSKKILEKDLATIKEIVNNVHDSTYRAHIKSKLAQYVATNNRKLTYYADPFITFQDLIRHTATPSTVAYGLFQISTIPHTLVHRLDVKKYTDKDVVTPHIGKDLTTPGRRTKLYKEIKIRNDLQIQYFKSLDYSD